MSSPCTTCGACCAGLRVQFHKHHVAPDGLVPADLVVPAPARDHVRLRGTAEGRCAALDGEVGRCVSCSIYALRPPPCRDFGFQGEDGRDTPGCDEAPARHGLPPLDRSASAA